MLTEKEKQIIKELQENLPLVSRPFKVLAERLDMEEQELIDKIKEFKQRGIMRRFGAAVRHQDLGYMANAMAVWQIPEDEIEKAGKNMARFSEVSHCYQRPTYPGWPYNLFTVLHAKSEEDCKRIAEYIAEETGYFKYKLIFSTRELKKTSMKYFTD